MHVPASIADRIMPRVLAHARRQPTRRPLVVEHHLHGVTPEQLSWWWGHIDTTARYQRWHPRDHLRFAWEVPPDGTHIGAIQVVRTMLGAMPATLRVRFDDPAGIKTAFSHILAATVIDAQGQGIMRWTHAYDAVAGGTRMRSTFHLPPLLYVLLGMGLRQHNREEMANLSHFLPTIYAQERTALSRPEEPKETRP